MGGLQLLWYRFIRWLAKVLVFQATGGMKVIGAERVPKHGALIVAPNHSSYLDPPAMGCSLPRPLTFMAKGELFKNKLFGKLIRSLGAFPVHRGTTDMESIRLALSILDSGRALLVFPEGTRNSGDDLLPFNRGVEMLARKSGAAVLPTAIIGSAQKWGKGKGFKFAKVTVVFGTPIKTSDFDGQGKEAFTQALEGQIRSMLAEHGQAPKTAVNMTPGP